MRSAQQVSSYRIRHTLSELGFLRDLSAGQLLYCPLQLLNRWRRISSLLHGGWVAEGGSESWLVLEDICGPRLDPMM